MEEPKSLDSLFKEKIFRIPDYQRGYAWQKGQLKDFWEDLINLSANRSHYTGVLTLKEAPQNGIEESDKEYWLVDDHSYKMYHIVDGQQRLATFVIFLQAFIDVVKQIPENQAKVDKEIYITDSLNLASVNSKYLYKIKPTGDQYRTYKFGYTVDNPSYSYLRYKIFNEPGAGSIEETFYTLNLKNAKQYFFEQLKELYEKENLAGLQDVYKKLTKKFVFNEYVIKDEFDVFVAFETMNNRGKKLSDLELLKNRLIYLTTLYTDQELDTAERCSLREDVNSAWKEVYHQLGRNEKRPLNDDDFLKAHWIMYFKYSRKRGNDYIQFFLDEQFSPQKVHKKVEREVTLDLPEEQRTEFEIDDSENENGEVLEGVTKATTALLQPTEISDYVHSLKTSAVHWFNSHYPHLAPELNDSEKQILDKLNRIGMGYFRPLVMAVLKDEATVSNRIKLFNDIERFIFIVFRLGQARRNYRDSEFYNAAREFDKGELTLDGIEKKLKDSADYLFNEGGAFNAKYFYDYLYKRFNSEGRSGYYGWHGLRYFLYEYELSLLAGNRQQKVYWEDLLKTLKDKISIEHIYPQTPENAYWQEKFKALPEQDIPFFQGSIGNLLLLSASINSSLQNDSFDDKKQPKFDDHGEKVRNGYADGSHSEIEISHYDEWSPMQIKERGLKLLCFMEYRWRIKFKNTEEKEKILFLKSGDSEDKNNW
jgi:uncharacterized protein with ParB-like and HNH nuclease domain